jgi:nitroimidazol reductase NimA-like FMN-containing flavoprotein (pyridoxamine 5'-phosphate oxidase superfamily)
MSVMVLIPPPELVPAVAEPEPPPRISAELCRTLLGGAVHGHLALSQGALPLVVPVSCALAGDYLLARAALGWLGRSAFEPGVVAFAISDSSGDQSRMWEVLVRGRAEVIEIVPGTAVPPPLPLVENERTTVFRISMELLTGWQYGPPPPPQGS